MAGHIVPLDAVGVEVVEDGQAGLLGGRVLSGGSVVRLRKASSSSVRPMRRLIKANGPGAGVPPSDSSGVVVDNSASPEEPLGILGDESVELVHLRGSVKGHWLHAHGLAVFNGLVVLKVSASKLPSDNISLSLPDVVGSLGFTLGGASTNSILARGLSLAGE